MNKELVLERLWNTVEMLANLPDEAFRYGDFVSKSSKRTNCGTVCCVAGWYPKYFPEANLGWKRDEEGFLDMVCYTAKGKESEKTTYELLRIYHGLPKTIIDFLFYGGSFCISDAFAKQMLRTDLQDQIYAMWKNHIVFIKSAFGFNVNAMTKNGLRSKRSQVQIAFEFIYYLIDNDYISFTYKK